MEIIFYQELDTEELIYSLKNEKCHLKKFQKTYFLYDYKNQTIKDCIWQMKFKGNKEIARIFGKALSEKIKLLGADDFLLVPTPIHNKRRRERGFNQCERLCEEITKNITSGSFSYNSKILMRNKYTIKQSWSSKKERQDNLKNIFKVNPKFKKDILGRKIILIDDVITTGSTIKEMHRALRDCGASLVISIVIAH